MALWVLPAPQRTTGEDAELEAEPEAVEVATIGRTVMVSTTTGIRSAEITSIVTAITTQDGMVRTRTMIRATIRATRRSRRLRIGVWSSETQINKFHIQV